MAVERVSFAALRSRIFDRLAAETSRDEARRCMQWVMITRVSGRPNWRAEAYDVPFRIPMGLAVAIAAAVDNYDLT